MPFEGFIRGQRVGVIVTATPTISTSVYASGDQVGSLMTFSGVAKLPGGSGRITIVTALDKGKQMASLELHLWTAAPTVTSVDQGVADITDANWVTAMATYLGAVQIASWQAWSGNAVASVPVGIDYKCSASLDDVFGLLIVRGTPTYVSTTDLVIGLSTNQD